MAARTTFANLTDGLQLCSLFDLSLADMGNLGVIPCLCAGTNALTLTPLTAAHAPTQLAYADGYSYSFTAAASASGPLTANAAGLGIKPIYLSDGTTAATTGNVVAGSFYQITYSATLNSGAGGFFLGTDSGGGVLPNTFAVGDLLYADTTTTLARLADIASGNVLLSGNVGVAPAYGKVGLTTHVSGILPIANGGTAVATLTGLAVGNGISPFTAVTVTGTAAEITVTNGNGTGGNPTLSLPAALTFTGKTVTGGTLVSPTLTTPDIGAATGTSLVLTNNQNAASFLTTNNNSTGSGALAGLLAQNSVGSGQFAIGSTTFATTILQNRAYVHASPTSAGIAINNAAANPTVFGISNVEVGRWDSVTPGVFKVGLAGTSLGQLALQGNTSGATTVVPAAAASGTLTLPSATDTLVGKATTDALTNKTVNGLTITSSTGTLAVSNGKTLSAGNTLTFTGTDGSAAAFGAGGTVAYTGNKLSVFAATTSAELASVISDETGTGALMFATAPVFGNYGQFPEISSPSNPPAANLLVFVKNVAGVSHLFTRNSAGTEVDITNGGSGVAAATQAEMEAASSTTVFVSPGRTQYHPGVAKAWVNFTDAGSSPCTINASYNVSSVTRNAAGDYTVNFTTAFSSATYAGLVSFEGSTSAAINMNRNFAATQIPATASAQRFACYAVFGAGAAVTAVNAYYSAFGDQ